MRRLRRHISTAVQGYLTALGTAFAINPRMVRGLDYYTKTTFEMVTGSLGAQNAVAAGGRYDGLVAIWAAPPCRASALPWGWSGWCC